MLAIAIPALLNLILNLALVPRFGLQGALWATLASYGVGVCVSYVLGRRSLALPIPWSMLSRAALASAAMGAAVYFTPAYGGMAELLAKALIGVAVYGLLAWLFDLCGARTRSARLLQALRTRTA
jgi:O-antigen/teichoic acid export membrane protein